MDALNQFQLLSRVVSLRFSVLSKRDTQFDC